MQLWDYFSVEEAAALKIQEKILKIGAAEKCLQYAFSLQLPNEREFAIFTVGRAFGQYEAKK